MLFLTIKPTHVNISANPKPMSVFRLQRASESPRKLVKIQTARLHPQPLILSVSLGWGLRNVFSNWFPDDADAAGLGTTSGAAQTENLNDN